VTALLNRGVFDTRECDRVLAVLEENGSYAARGFMKPEGIVCFHTAAQVGFKKTLKDDGVPKSLQGPNATSSQ